MKINSMGILPLCVSIACVIILSALTAIPVAAWTTYPLKATDPEISSALDYLESQQQANGSIGRYDESGWVAMAIAAAGEDPNDWSAGGPSLVEYLEANTAELESEFNLDAAHTRTILVAIAAGEDPADFAGTDYVSLLKASYNATSGQFGSATQLNEDCWAIISLTAAGTSQGDEMVVNAAAFIEANQNADGGWGWQAGAVSDADSTATSIMALMAAGEPQGSTAVQDALGYMKSNQMDNGGFESWGATNADTDSWCICAIVAAGQGPNSANWHSQSGKGPVDDLTTYQTDSGSFDWQAGDAGWSPHKTTASAIVALLGKTYPVTTISPPEPTFTPTPTPSEGSSTVWIWTSIGVVWAIGLAMLGWFILGLRRK